MNRQVRRIEERKERKTEKDKAKAKADREARKREIQDRRKRRREAAKQGKQGEGGQAAAKEAEASSGGKRRSNPGRFAGALMVATVFFIILQAVAPADESVPGQLVSASFYLLFGYFSVLWMMRRGRENPVRLAVIAAAVLGAGTAASRIAQPAVELAPLMLALILPLAVAGALLGRVVYRNAP